MERSETQYGTLTKLGFAALSPALSVLEMGYGGGLEGAEGGNAALRGL